MYVSTYCISHSISNKALLDFDLVRLYHPDKAGLSIPSDVAHARFQAITAAYDILRGKKPAADDPLGYGSSTTPAVRYQTTAAYRAMRKKRQELYNSGPVDDSKKDKLIVFGVIMVRSHLHGGHAWPLSLTYLRPLLL